ncbi:MAG TPA: cyclase family protein [Opitutaceae bacterium]|nr:cyclase family protein [Opitutaceae bacterium]
MNLIDISRPIYSGMPVWPGDTDAKFDIVATIAGGAVVNIGALKISIHTGTHVDAPWHYADAGATIDRVEPDAYVGPARVIDARGCDSLSRDLFDGIDLAPTPRVLFRTDVWTDPQVFPRDWPVMEEGLPDWLATQGVTLVGLDIPSVDKLDSKTLPVHLACFRANLLILESTNLRETEPGIYELIALPLRIRGGDGSPVRAVLRPME